MASIYSPIVGQPFLAGSRLKAGLDTLESVSAGKIACPTRRQAANESPARNRSLTRAALQVSVGSKSSRRAKKLLGLVNPIWKQVFPDNALIGP
jgi:hypothetical protein